MHSSSKQRQCCNQTCMFRCARMPATMLRSLAGLRPKAKEDGQSKAKPDQKGKDQTSNKNRQLTTLGGQPLHEGLKPPNFEAGARDRSQSNDKKDKHNKCQGEIFFGRRQEGMFQLRKQGPPEEGLSSEGSGPVGRWQLFRRSIQRRLRDQTCQVAVL